MARVPKVTLQGQPAPHWQSLSRTFKFYQRALESAFEVTSDENPAGDVIRVVFSNLHPAFSHNRSSAPILLALHGTTILKNKALKTVLSMLRECDGLLVNCRSDERLLRALLVPPFPQIFVLPLPIAKTGHPHSPLTLRATLKLGKRTSIIGFIARLIPQKNLHTLVELVAHLNRFQDTVAIVVGDYWADYPVLDYGQNYAHFISDLAKRLRVADRIVRFNASLTGRQLTDVISGCDLIFHPTETLDENYGYIPLDAVCLGTPLIGNGYGGLKDTIPLALDALTKTWPTAGGLRADYRWSFQQATRVMQGSKECCLSEVDRQVLRRKFSFTRCAGVLVEAVHRCGNFWAEGRRVQVGGTRARGLSSSRIRVIGATDTWDDYWWPATFYCSQRRCINLGQIKSVKIFAPWRHDGEWVTFSHPLWPIQARVTKAELHFFEHLGTKWHLVEQFNDVEKRMLQRAIRDGMLTGSIV
jgi:hypothetical protein